MNRTPFSQALLLSLLLGAFATVFAAASLGGPDSVGVLAKSLTEPARLVRVLLLEIAPANLVVIGFVAWILLDSFSLARRMPPAASRLFQEATMLILAAVLTGQYLKLSALASTTTNTSTAAILSAFGLAAIGFASILVIKTRRYLTVRGEVIGQLGSRRRDHGRLPVASPNPWLRRIAITAAAGVLIALVLSRLPHAAASSEGTEAPVQKSDLHEPASQQRVVAKSEPVRVQQETIERITVGAQAKSGTGPAGETGDASLPSGLRFSWQSGGNGYEPAFIKRTRDGNYWWRGQRVPPNATLLRAFALDGTGPAVRPDGENSSLLFFHRDVLSRLHNALAGQLSESSHPSVSVDRDGTDVVLRITASGKSAQTLVVSPANL
ncbi:MAG: hypothetical protein HZA93_18670 [Verrucomicrobia bacterium]|nr:hypothetical protein [Verrucomicrobiota bacterium]